MYQIDRIPQPKWDKKNKKWTLSIMIDGKRKQFVSRTPGMPGKRDCRDRAKEWIENGHQMPEKLKFEVAYQRFIEDYTQRHGENEQLRVLKDIGRLFLIPELGSKDCSKITIDDWQGIISNARPLPCYRKDGTVYYRTKRFSRKYLGKIRSAITSFVKWGAPRHICEWIPESGLYIPSDAPRGSREILQLSDIEKLFSEPTGLWYERIFQFEVLTGWRPGEVIGLQWQDINEQTGVVTINRSVNNHGEITEGKNRNAHRSLQLTPELKTILKDQKEATAYLESPWVFCNQIGGKARQNAIRRAWKTIVEKRGLPENTTPYSLRHTFFTHTEAYLPDRIIKTIFGHSEATPSHELYGNHIIDGELKEASERLQVTPLFEAAKKKSV